jgi:hypothetical protein
VRNYRKRQRLVVPRRIVDLGDLPAIGSDQPSRNIERGLFNPHTHALAGFGRDQVVVGFPWEQPPFQGAASL